MAGKAAQHFMDQINAMEASRDVQPLVKLFSAQATLSRAGQPETEHGTEGAVVFWQHYLDAFRDVRSEFTRVLETDGHAVLEWVSSGHLPDGKPLRYEGVSLVEFDGAQVRSFRTYYDTAAFLTPAVTG